MNVVARKNYVCTQAKEFYDSKILLGYKKCGAPKLANYFACWN
jgi:hypothetical protein